jgi:hypothetical protein
MIKIHHLNYSRSTRVIWLMEELGEPYEIVQHTRDPNTFRSRQTLERVHPLGKAPVIEDGPLMLAESAPSSSISSRPMVAASSPRRRVGLLGRGISNYCTSRRDQPCFLCL